MNNDQIVLPKNEAKSDPRVKNKYIFMLVVFVVLGLGTSFVSGFFVSRLVNIPVEPVNTPFPTSIPEQPVVSLGDTYVSDEIVLVSKDGTSFALAATASRFGRDEGYSQNTNVSLFDGEIWRRTAKGHKTNSLEINTNETIVDWSIKIDDTRVLKETTNIELNFEGNTISFSTGVLENEISMRSLPAYTKFMSRGETSVTVNGEVFDVYLVYTRIYSNNSSEIQFLGESLDVTTHWAAFWDTEGNFYHVDSSDVGIETEIYKTHQIGVLVDSNNRVTKTFDVGIATDTSLSQISYGLENPISQTINMTVLNKNNKAPNSSYLWFSGMTNGYVEDLNGNRINGVGFIEYIKD